MATLGSGNESLAEGPQDPEALRQREFVDFITKANNSEHTATVPYEFDPFGGQLLYVLLAQTGIGDFLVLPGEELTGDFTRLPLGSTGSFEPLCAKEQPDSVVLTTTFEEGELDEGGATPWSRSVSLTFAYEYDGGSCAVQELGVVLLSSGEFGVYSMCSGYNDGLLFSDHRSGYSVEPKMIQEFVTNMKTAIKAATVESILQ